MINKIKFKLVLLNKILNIPLHKFLQCNYILVSVSKYTLFLVLFKIYIYNSNNCQPTISLHVAFSASVLSASISLTLERLTDVESLIFIQRKPAYYRLYLRGLSFLYFPFQFELSFNRLYSLLAGSLIINVPRHLFLC